MDLHLLFVLYQTLAGLVQDGCNDLDHIDFWRALAARVTPVLLCQGTFRRIQIDLDSNL